MAQCNCSLRLQLHDAIYRPDSSVLILRHCVNLKAIRYESTSLNRIVADKSHRVIIALARNVLQLGNLSNIRDSNSVRKPSKVWQEMFGPSSQK